MSAVLPVANDVTSKSSATGALVDRVPTWVLVLLGVAFVALSGGRFGVEALAWIAPVPWLLWLRRIHRWPSRLAVLVAAMAAVTLQFSTIITEPIPAMFAVLFGVPVGIGLWLLLMVWDGLRRRTSEALALYALPALAAVSDLVGSTWGLAGTWGTASANVSDNLVVLQLASVFGVAGVGFVVAWVASWIATVLAAPRRREWLGHGLVLAVALVAVAGFGTWRLAQPSTGTTVPVAAVVTDLGLSPAGLPTEDALRANVDTLFERSGLAADRGARLVVWNEGATAVRPADEAELLSRGQAFARERGVDLVLAYIVVTQEAPLAFRNRAVFVDDAGRVLTTYHKRHPVPGETEPSDNPVPRLERPYGVVSLAICYDQDFPEMARGHAAVGAELVAVPSSDWAGIDPVHTKMARTRAIEGGYSMLRATRWAASAGFDAMGRVRGWMRVDEANDRVLVTELPTERVPTVYATIGDAPVSLAGLYLVGLAGLALRRRRRG